MADVDGNEVGRMLYDGFGSVLMSTVPITLTGVVADVPDAATGLVYQGGGKWYDPALGRPLQPNAAGGPPTVPQALNRFAATSFGQPGVAQAEYQRNAGARATIQQYLQGSTIGESIEGVLGIGVGRGVSKFAQLQGHLTIQANNAVLKRAGYQELFNKTGSINRHSLYESVLVAPLGNRRFGVQGSDLIIDLSILESKVNAKQWGVSYPGGQAFKGIDDTAFKRFLGSELGSELITGTIIEVAFGIPELIDPWQNPYFSPGQRLTQNFVTGAGIAAQIGVGAYVGTAVGGPVGFAVGVGVGVGLGVAWEYVVKPGVSWIAVNVFNQTDPYVGIRNLEPIGTN